jgi:hypothetical protein
MFGELKQSMGYAMPRRIFQGVGFSQGAAWISMEVTIIHQNVGFIYCPSFFRVPIIIRRFGFR